VRTDGKKERLKTPSEMTIRRVDCCFLIDQPFAPASRQARFSPTHPIWPLGYGKDYKRVYLFAAMPTTSIPEGRFTGSGEFDEK
jgi:hypothetical protein